MKNIVQFINEKFRLSKDCLKETYTPKTFVELQKIITDKLQVSHTLDMNDVDVSNIRSLAHAFSTWNIVELDVSDWDVSHIKNFNSMFNGCTYLRKIIGLENWDISNAKDMSFMFNNCKNLRDIGDLSKWNITRDIDIKCMFQNCKELRTVGDITHWDCKNPNWNIFISTPIKPIPPQKVI